jgi:4-hydroxy-4-methyl-2-oxoglutarate aldolase
MGSERAFAALELVNRLERLDSPAVADARRGLGVLHPRIHTLVPGQTIAGPAFTVRAYPGSMMTIQRALIEAAPGDVVVVDAGGDVLSGGLWGDLMSVEASRRALRGIVVDGAARDSQGLRRVGFPTFAAGVTPRLGTNLQIGPTQVPVSCGGVAIQPGDWLIGDDDGLVVIPAAELAATVTLAEAIKEKDREVARRLEQGEVMADILGFHRFLREEIENISVLSKPAQPAAC